MSRKELERLFRGVDRNVEGYTYSIVYLAKGFMAAE